MSAPPPLLSRLPPWLPPAVFGLLAALWACHGGFGDRVIGEGVDLGGTLWFHDLMLDSLRTLQRPGFTERFYWPVGLDLFVRTGSNVVDATVGALFQAALGSPRHYTPFLVMLLWTNALAMAHLCRGAGAGPAAATAGALCGVLHPWVLYELNQGRPTQAALAPMAMGLHHLLRLEVDPRLRHGLLAGAWIALQAWTYWFTAHFVAVAFGPLLLAAIWRSPAPRAALRAALAGVLLATVLVLPAVVPMAVALHADSLPLLDSVAMDRAGMTPLDMQTQSSWAPSRSPDAVLPVALLGAMAAALLLHPQRLVLGAAVVLGIGFAAGPALAFLGQGTPNPFWAVASAALPFLGRFWFPYRAVAVVVVLSAPLMAGAVTRMGAVLPRGLAWALVAAVAMALVGPLPESGQRLVSSPLAPPPYAEVLRSRPGPLLELPWLCSEEAVQDQIWHRQPLVGGMAVGSKAYRPVGAVERWVQDPLVAAAALASLSGQTPRAVAAGAHDPALRWVALHRRLYALTRHRQACWSGDAAVQDDARAALAFEAVASLLGPPTFDDGETAVWAWPPADGALPGPGSAP